MATVDEIKAQIHEEVDAFVVAVDLLLAELRAPEPVGVAVPPTESTSAPAAEPFSTVTGADSTTSTADTSAGAPSPSGVNTSQQDIIEPTPDPTPEESGEPSSPQPSAPDSSTPPDTTDL